MKLTSSQSSSARQDVKLVNILLTGLWPKSDQYRLMKIRFVHLVRLNFRLKDVLDFLGYSFRHLVAEVPVGFNKVQKFLHCPPAPVKMTKFLFHIYSTYMNFSLTIFCFTPSLKIFMECALSNEYMLAMLAFISLF